MPLGAWKILSPRIAWLAGGRLAASPFDLLRNYPSYFVAGILGFRSLSALPPLVILIGQYGLRPVMGLAVAWLVAVLANFLVIPVFLRRWDTGATPTVPWLVADLALAVALNLWGAWAVPGFVTDPYHDLFFFWYLGTALLWSVRFEVRAGVILSLASVPLQVAMTALSGADPLREGLAMTVGRTIWLLVAMYSASLMLWILRISTDGVQAEGVRLGRRSAQVQALRHLHDTALQTLEAIGLTAENERMDTCHRLHLIATAARQQAEDIRSVLNADGEDPPEDAMQQIADIVERWRRPLEDAGVSAVWRDKYGGRLNLGPETSQSLRQATEEALRNTVKHARASSVVVEGSLIPGGLQITITDDGCGFDPGRDEGFGIRHSIRARMADVKGKALVASAPHNGTSVTLQVPR
jgi:signal transduction histidine kinase